MVINELNPNQAYMPLVQQREKMPGGSARSTSFAGTIDELIKDVNNLQIESGKKVDQLIKGEPVDIHDVMISSQMAGTSFKLLMELRNKGLDLYNTVMRMQV